MMTGFTSNLLEFMYDVLAIKISQKNSLSRSCLVKTEGLHSCLLLQFKKLFPPTKWAAEFNAALTVPFFQWLVGPSEVN